MTARFTSDFPAIHRFGIAAATDPMDAVYVWAHALGVKATRMGDGSVLVVMGKTETKLSSPDYTMTFLDTLFTTINAPVDPNDVHMAYVLTGDKHCPAVNFAANPDQVWCKFAEWRKAKSTPCGFSEKTLLRFNLLPKEEPPMTVNEVVELFSKLLNTKHALYADYIDMLKKNRFPPIDEAARFVHALNSDKFEPVKFTEPRLAAFLCTD